MSARPTFCQVHGSHWPPLEASRGEVIVDLHHVQPQGMGGATVSANLVAVCANGHRKIHSAIRAILRDALPSGTHEEVRLARLGVSMWIAAGKPGNPE